MEDIPEHVDGVAGEEDYVDTEIEANDAGSDYGEQSDVPEEAEDELEELTKSSDEIREEEVNDLAYFEFPEETRPEDDATGRLAYRKKCSEFDFYLFPVNSVVQKFDLEILSLAHAGLGDKGAIALAESLKVNTRVRDLCLVDNWITPKGGKALLEAIMTNTSITKLDLSENRLGYRAAQVDGQTIGDCLKEVLAKNSTLKALSLRANKLADTDAVAVADGLCENFTLGVIDLAYNSLGPRAGDSIGNMLSTNGDLRELNLEWNQLRNEGTMAVLNGLKQNNVLKRVSIAWNGVSDKGGVAVGEVLLTNTSLEDVDVSHNRIGKQGAMKLAEGINDNHAIRRLVLSYNPLGDEGCTVIIAAVRNNTSLVFVDLKSTESGHGAAKEIQETKKKRGNRVEIHIPRSIFVPKGIKIT